MVVTVIKGKRKERKKEGSHWLSCCSCRTGSVTETWGEVQHTVRHVNCLANVFMPLNYFTLCHKAATISYVVD